MPSKQCVLCTAYRTVYGRDQFLTYRLKRKYESAPSKRNPVVYSVPLAAVSSNKKSKSTSRRKKFNSPSAIFHNIPMSTPAHKGAWNTAPAKDSTAYSAPPRCHTNKREHSTLQHITSPRFKDKIQKQITYSSDSESPVGERRLHKSSVYPEVEYGPYTDLSKSYPTVVASPKESFHEESQRIHARIKELMKKNDSVLVSFILTDSFLILKAFFI